MSVLRSTVSLFGLALVLSACQLNRSPAPVTTPAETTVTPAARPAAAAPAAQPQVAALPPVNDDPAQLLGLDRAGLSALLGEPNLVRKDAPAEIWQYVGDDCVFDVVLYQRGSDYAVSYLEARDASAAVQPAQPCLNALLRARQAAPVS